MRWQTVVAALGLGMAGGAGWVLWDQRPQQSEPVVATLRPQPPPGEIPLIVKRDGRAVRLRWSAQTAGIRNAKHGTLVITEGEHQSTLHLDNRELRSGLASYWPDGKAVAFRLETDAGASGTAEVPAEGQVAAPPKPEEPKPAAEGPKSSASAAPVRRRPKRADTSDRTQPIDDGLEWTQEPRPSPFGNGKPALRPVVKPIHRVAPPRAQVVPVENVRPESRADSRWTRLKKKLSFWHKPDTEPRP